MYDAINVWDTFRGYVGGYLWMLLLSVSMIYILYKSTLKSRKIILLAVIASIICLYNDISRNLVGRVVEIATYYRFFWLMPVSLICAYAMLLFLTSNIAASCKIATPVVILLLLSIFGADFSKGFTIPDNYYQVPDDVFVIQNIIDGNKGDDELPVICFPAELELCYRTIDSDVQYGVGRGVYINYFSAEQIGNKVYLQQLVTSGIQTDPVLMKQAIFDYEVDFIVAQTAFALDAYMESIGCCFVGASDTYSIYKIYNNNDNEEIFDPEVLSSIGMLEENVEVVIPGLESEYNFIWLSDLHIIAEGDEIAEENMETVQERLGWSSNSQGQTAADYWNLISDHLDACEADAILFGADMVDFASTPTIESLKGGLDKLTTPYIYVRADHDSQPYYCDGITKEQCNVLHAGIDGNDEIWLQEFEELCVVGISESTSQMTESALAAFKEIYAIGKPIILVTHVPLDSKVDCSLADESKAVWNDRALIWGTDCTYSPNETTQEFLNMVYAEDSLVKEVLCGHLHFEWDGYITENTHEHVFGAAFAGEYGVITVRGE